MNVRRGAESGRITPLKKPTAAEQNKIESHPLESLFKEKALLLYAVLALLLIVMVFHRYLLADVVYLFKGIGSDTITYSWTHWAHLSDYIRNVGFPGWSFSEGMGKNIYPFSIGNPFSLILILLPKAMIPYSIVYIEVLKVFLGGLFFFMFLRTSHFTAYSSVIGGLLYAFCGYMIAGSTWYIFSTEAVYASFALYSCEKFLRQGVWYLLPLAFFLIAATQPFWLYLYGLLLSVYCFAKIAGNEGWLWKKMFLTVAKIGVLAFLGVLLSSFIFLSNLDLLIHNPRSMGESSSFAKLSSEDIFEWSSLSQFISTIGRLFSNDLLGTGEIFGGWKNYLESPLLYAGLVTLLLIPQAFYVMEKRKRILHLTFTLLCLLPIFFPFLRHAFWLFTGDYYRSYTFFLSLLFLFYSLKALSLFDTIPKLNKPLLLITLAVLLTLLYFPYSSNQTNPLHNTIRTIVTFFLLIYTGLMYGYAFPKLKTLAASLLGITIFIELGCLSYITVNYRHALTHSELKGKMGYNDYSNDALAFINSRDAGFFRIDKDFSSSPTDNSAGYNDAVFQNYKSTASYDEFNQVNYVHFLNELKVWSPEPNNNRWVAGLITRRLLSSSMNGKYILATHKYSPPPFGYDSITTIGNVTIFQNLYYLPFGYTYQNYISLPEFRKLNTFQKDNMLLKAFVADDKDLPALKSLNQLYARDTIPGTSINKDVFRSYLTSLEKDTLTNLHYNENNITATISPAQTKLLFLSIPFDRGWLVKVDGKKVVPLMTNIGFMGIILTPGTHSIELHYSVPLLKVGCFLSGLGSLLYIFLLARFRKKRF